MYSAPFPRLLLKAVCESLRWEGTDWTGFVSISFLAANNALVTELLFVAHAKKIVA